MIADGLRDSHAVFARTGARAALIGGMAMAAHGCARNTLDIDWLLDRRSVDAVESELMQLGYRRLQRDDNVACYFREPDSRIDFILAHRPLAMTMLDDALAVEIANLNISLLRVEDIIGLKVQALASNPKRVLLDSADIEALARKHAAMLDRTRVRQYYAVFQREGEWDELIGRVDSGG